MIKLEHTVFSAPFMLVSMLLAAGQGWPSLLTFLWCAIALLGARSAAMSLNRLIDHKIDALNPRTAERALPSGKISPQNTFLMSLFGFCLLALAAFNLPAICLYLLPVAILFLSGYSYCKRFTWLCHWVLGLCLGGAVLGGWLAVTGQFSHLPVFLGLAVCLWVAGFDILYALQDINFDKINGLFSLPACFGREKALLISRMCHFMCLTLFILCGFWVVELGRFVFIFYGIACLMAVIALYQQHKLINKDESKIESVFFMANAVISSLFFVLVLAGKLLQFLIK